jgi:hypothetical protein
MTNILLLIFGALLKLKYLRMKLVLERAFHAVDTNINFLIS